MSLGTQEAGKRHKSREYEDNRRRLITGDYFENSCLQANEIGTLTWWCWWWGMSPLLLKCRWLSVNLMGAHSVTWIKYELHSECRFSWILIHQYRPPTSLTARIWLKLVISQKVLFLCLSVPTWWAPLPIWPIRSILGSMRLRNVLVIVFFLYNLFILQYHHCHLPREESILSRHGSFVIVLTQAITSLTSIDHLKENDLHSWSISCILIKISSKPYLTLGGQICTPITYLRLCVYA